MHLYSMNLWIVWSWNSTYTFCVDVTESVNAANRFSGMKWVMVLLRPHSLLDLNDCEDSHCIFDRSAPSDIEFHVCEFAYEV